MKIILAMHRQGCSERRIWAQQGLFQGCMSVAGRVVASFVHDGGHAIDRLLGPGGQCCVTGVGAVAVS